jgi:hypothetical protein
LTLVFAHYVLTAFGVMTLPKLDVAGSIPVSRSIFFRMRRALPVLILPFFGQQEFLDVEPAAEEPRSC